MPNKDLQQTREADAWAQKRNVTLPSIDAGRDSTNIRALYSFFATDGVQDAAKDEANERDDMDGFDHTPVIVQPRHIPPRSGRMGCDDQVLVPDVNEVNENVLDYVPPPEYSDSRGFTSGASDISSGTLASQWGNIERTLRRFFVGVSTLASPKEFLRWENAPNRRSTRYQSSRGERVANPLTFADRERKKAIAAAVTREAGTKREAGTRTVFARHGWDVSCSPPRYIGRGETPSPAPITEPTVIAVEAPKHLYRKVMLKIWDAARGDFLDAMKFILEPGATDTISRAWQKGSEVQPTVKPDLNTIIQSPVPAPQPQNR